MSAAPAEDLWAQCENGDCKKWRKLPPGSVVDDNLPWFCAMNPDASKNRCTASEESYHEDELWEEEEVSMAVNQVAKASKKGKKSGGQSSKKGKADSSKKRKRDEQSEKPKGRLNKSTTANLRDAGRGGEATRVTVSKAKLVGELKKRAQKFSKIMSRDRMSGDFYSSNMSDWNLMCTHAPQVAKMVCEAANWVSAAKYFKRNGHNGKELYDLSLSLHQMTLRYAAAVSSQNAVQILTEAGEKPTVKPNVRHEDDQMDVEMAMQPPAGAPVENDHLLAMEDPL